MHEIRRPLFLLPLALAITLAVTPALAVQPQDGFFYGVDLDPLAGEAITAVETEPAVALIFSATDDTTEITTQFTQWYNKARSSGINAFAIAVVAAGESPEATVEAVRQRGLSMPVYIAKSDMLLGDSYRLLVLNDDQEVQRYTTPDFAAVNTALDTIGVSVPADSVPAIAPTSPDTNPAPPVSDQTPSVEENIVGESTPPPVAEARVLGGSGGDPLYRNSQYGFEVEFPSNWQYRVPGKNDGAIALVPQGSRMDMRVWSVPASGKMSPQQYVDNTLDSLARKHKTRIDVNQKFRVTARGSEGVDVSYVYTRPINVDNPAMGSLLYRGRMQVFTDGGYAKVAAVEAPSGEFMANMAIIDSFLRSFKLAPVDIPMPAQPNIL